MIPVPNLQDVAKPEVAIVAHAPVKTEYVESPSLNEGRVAAEGAAWKVSGSPDGGLDTAGRHVSFGSAPIGGTTTRQEVSITLAPQAWSPRLEREFQALAESDVLGSASPEQRAALGRMQVLRRQLKNPRPAGEVLFEMRREVMLDDLTQRFASFIEFIDLGLRDRLPVELHSIVQG